MKRVYAERLIPRARHIEVQIVGDGSGEVSHLFERECTIQRRHQKLVEIAPSPGLFPHLRDQIIAAAVRIARELRYTSLGTFEFLIDAAAQDAGEAIRSEPMRFAFIEANPRLQVEHTVTEEVLGVDLVKLQLRLAGGASLAEIGASQSAIRSPRGFAIKTRIDLEAMNPDGSAKPTGGTLTASSRLPAPASALIVCLFRLYHQSTLRFAARQTDCYSSSPECADVVRKAYRALGEFRIEGVATNLGFLQNLLSHPDFVANRIFTRFIEDDFEELAVTQAGAIRATT